MGNIVVSIGIKHNVYAITIVEQGMLKDKFVEEIKDEEVASSKHLGAIYTFASALRLVRRYLNDNKESRDVCFEFSNSIFLGWLEKQYSKDAYQDKFMETLNLLQELPIRYTFTYNPKPKALSYATLASCTKGSLSGLDLD